jgi:hypothetical protein
LLLCLSTTPRRHTKGVEVKLHAFYTLALDEREWSDMSLQRRMCKRPGRAETHIAFWLENLEERDYLRRL